MFIKLTNIRNDGLMLVNTDDIVSVTVLSNGGRITLRSREVLDFTEKVEDVEQMLVPAKSQPEKPAPSEKK